MKTLGPRAASRVAHWRISWRTDVRAMHGFLQERETLGVRSGDP
jgi:hypothetical protein